MRFFLIILIVLILAGVGVGGYYGFVPVVSDIFGSNKPRDLGVSYTAADNDNYNLKSKATITVKKVEQELPSDELMEFSGKADIDVSFTQEEFTARANNVAWPHFPFENSQVKINDDGTIEVSTVLKVEKIEKFLLAVGYDRETVSKAKSGLDKASILSKRPPVYFKARPGVKNNKSSFDLISAEIGRIQVPLDNFDANGTIMGMFDRIFPLIDNLDARSADFNNGTFNFEGTVPTDLTIYN
jgi:hypothetical protein